MLTMLETIREDGVSRCYEVIIRYDGNDIFMKFFNVTLRQNFTFNLWRIKIWFYGQFFEIILTRL